MPTQRSALAPASVWARDADFDISVQQHEKKVHAARGLRLIYLAFATLGVVYGDIGTSPLYTFASVYPDGAPQDANHVLGVFSMIFWTLTALVLVKYVFIVLAMDDHGEGGTFALYSRLCRAAHLGPPGQEPQEGTAPSARPAASSRLGRRAAAKVRGLFATSPGLQQLLLVVVLLSACMVMSDGVLTPAISVVSAAEGLQFNTGISRAAVVGISCAILAALFLLQAWGTARISWLFSPIILLWFLSNASIGIYNIAISSPGVFRALSPHYIYFYWQGDAHSAWLNLGHVMLAVTGAEALYADMGHFSRGAIQLSFTAFVYPCLTLTYLGQAAMILERPEAAAAAYWESLPHPVKWPMLALATLAAIIASQALISGAFSIVQQAVALNCFPRVTIRHTSETIRGQVYIPEVNFLLMAGVLAVVLIFQTSTRIGNAYGLAVILVMLITTSLAALAMILCWECHLLSVTAFWLAWTFIEGAYLSSNLEKIPKGGWFTLALSVILALVCYTWHWGQELKLRYIRQHAVPVHSLLQPQEGQGRAESAGGGRGYLLRLGGAGPAVLRAPGVGIYYTELIQDVPPFLSLMLSRLPVLHEVSVLLSVRSVPIPHVPAHQQLLVRKFSPAGLYRVVVRYGYMDRINHTQAFVDGMVKEIAEYLSPGMGFGEGLDPLGGPSIAAPWVQGMQPTPYPTVAPSPPGTLHLQGGAAAAAAIRADLELGKAFTDRRGAMGGVLASERTYPWVQQPSNYRRLRTLGMARASSQTEDISEGPHTMPAGRTAERLSARLAPLLRRAGTSAPARDDALGGAVTMPLLPSEPRTAFHKTSFVSQRPDALATSAGPPASRETHPSLPPPTPPSTATSSGPGAAGVAATGPPAGPRPGGGLPSPNPSPSESLSPAALKALGRDLAVQLAARRETAVEAAAAAAPSDQGPANLPSAAPLSSDALEVRRQIFTLPSDGPPLEGAGAGAAQGSEAQQAQQAACLAEEQEQVLAAHARGGATYLLGRSKLVALDRGAWLKVAALEGAFAVLANNSRSRADTFGIPASAVLELGVTYEV